VDAFTREPIAEATRLARMEAVRAVLPAFGVAPDARLAPVTSGHINESWHVRTAEGELLLQWLNGEVFPEPDAVQDNLEAALDHLASHSTDAVVLPRLHWTPDGRRRVHDALGLWRAFRWLPGRAVLERPDDPAQARSAGRALGAALQGLGTMPVERLHAVLAGFHDLGARLAALDAARDAAPAPRLEAARSLLGRVDAARGDRLAAAPDEARPRALHGDPKFTNFLFAAPGVAVALVDWDTVLAGPLAWDLGDFLRSAASRGGEDRPEAAAVDRELLDAGVSGFLEGLGEPLEAAALPALAAAPAHMAFMLGVRFLTDHLAGDRYFRVRRPDHNLDRAATQLALADGFDAARGVLVERLAAVQE
jgi:aminoglycoside phosphotransferase (APT) family kinase protein